MAFDLQLSQRAIDAVQQLGVPVAYLLFNVFLFVWLLRQAHRRAEKAELRNEELQTHILRLATAQTAATMKTAAALTSVAEKEP